jgi:hypothetical protein
MPKKCQPGVICIENVTFVILFFLFSVISYLFFQNIKKNNSNSIITSDNMLKSMYSLPLSMTNNNYVRNNVPDREILNNEKLFIRANPSYSYSNNTGDVLLNPYAAPLKDERYFPNMPISLDIRGTPVVPINVKTSINAIDTDYRQIGILKKNDGSETILPLMGRPLLTSKDKWNFYTMNENNIKLPIRYKNRSCTDEYGCDNIYTGDSVDVEGLNNNFKVTIYDNATMRYIPFL